MKPSHFGDCPLKIFVHHPAQKSPFEPPYKLTKPQKEYKIDLFFFFNELEICSKSLSSTMIDRNRRYKQNGRELKQLGISTSTWRALLAA